MIKNNFINFQKQPFADVSQYLQETPVLEFPFTIVLKRDSNTDASLWILQNFSEQPIFKNICERLLVYF